MNTMASDPVADKSGFLCMYMSNHPDTLVSYVRYWGKVKEPVSTAKLVSIDTKVCTPSVRRDIRVPGADATACDVGHEPHVPDEGQ